MADSLRIGKLIPAVLGVALLVISAFPAEATNYPLNQTSGILGPWTSNYTFGYRFQCIGQGVQVTHLSCYPGSMTSCTLKLWTDSGSQLAVVTPTGSAMQWNNAQLATPIMLTQNSYYRVSVHVTSYARFTVGTWNGDSNIRYILTYYNAETAHNFPNTFSSPSYIWGVPDLGYRTGPPPPASITVPANSSGGNYTITWSSVSGATSYELEEDTVSGFTNPTQVYNGPNTSHSFTNHAPGTYYYRVRARDAIGPSGWTVGGNPCVVTVPPPPAPASITVPAQSTGSFTVTWATSAGATIYQLQEANNAAFNGAATLYTGANTTYNVTGKVGGTWYYRVRAGNAGGSSAWTAGANGCQIVPPNPPASITVPATTVSGNFTVTWTASAGASSYHLQEDTSAGFTNPFAVYAGSNTSYNVTGKTSGTYYYRVRANNSVGSSAWTAGANGCTVTPPNPPPSITVPTQSVTGNYQVTWGTSTGASSYDLEEDATAAFTNPTQVYSGPNTFFDVTGKTAGTFHYRVRATGITGSSNWLAGANGCQIVPPAAPATITVPAQSATGIYQVTWSSSTGATSYDLEEDTSSAFTNPTPVYSGSNTSYNVTGKTVGTFFYRVRATNGAGPGAFCLGGNGCTIIPPNPPSTLTVPATSSTGTYTVTWSSSTGAVSYDLQEDTSNIFSNPTTLCNGANTSYAVVGRNNGTYYYRVSAANGAGQSTWTVDLTGCTVTLVPPTAPVSVTVPVSSSTGNFVVSWTAVTGAWTYELEESLNPSFASTTQVYAGSSTSFSVTGRANGLYYYQVRAVNGAGTSTWTAGANGCTVQQMAPAPPGFLNVPATSSTGTYSVGWGTSSGATLYELEEAQDIGFGGALNVYRGGGTSVTVTGRPAGTYYYRVRASNVVGTSNWMHGPNGCVVSPTITSLDVLPGSGNPDASQELPGASGVPMLHLKMSAGSVEGIVLLSLRVHSTGSGDDAAEISNVVLWRDVNGDGSAGSGDVQVGSGTFNADEGFVSFDLTGEPAIGTGGTAWYLVTCDFSGMALAGSDFSFSVNPGFDLSCQGNLGGSPVTASGPTVAGGLKTVATSGVGSLRVSPGANNPPAGTAEFPTDGVPMLQIRFSASSMEGVTISRIQFTATGSGDESAGLTARLLEDVDGDGRDSFGDVELGSVTIASDNGTVIFPGLTLTVPVGSSTVLLLVYDFDGSTVPGTYGASLEVGADIYAVGQGTAMGITPTGVPVAAGLKSLVEKPEGRLGAGASYFMGGCAGGASSPTAWLGWLLLAAGALAVLTLRRRAVSRG